MIGVTIILIYLKVFSCKWISCYFVLENHNNFLLIIIILISFSLWTLFVGSSSTLFSSISREVAWWYRRPKVASPAFTKMIISFFVEYHDRYNFVVKMFPEFSLCRLSCQRMEQSRQSWGQQSDVFGRFGGESDPALSVVLGLTSESLFPSIERFL